MSEQFKIFKYFIAPQKAKFFVVLILALCTAFFEYLTMGLVFNFTNSMFAVEGVAPPINNKFFMILQNMIDLLPVASPFTASCVALSLAAIAGAVFAFLFYYYNEHLVQSVRRYLQKVLASRYLESEYQFFLNRKQGDLLFNILQAPQFVITVLSLAIKMLIAVLTLSLFIVLLFTVSVRVTFIVLGICAVMGMLIAHFSNKIGYVEGKKASDALSALSVSINEFITNIKDVKVNCLDVDVRSRIAISLDKFFDAKMKVVFYRTFINRVLPAMIIVGIFTTLIFVRANNMLQFTELLPAFMVYIVAILKSIPIVKDIGTISISLSHYYPNLQLLYDEMHAEDTKIAFNGDQEISKINDIHFQNVSFSYGNKKVLDNVSFNIPKNNTIALVGGSGSGKTTITNLILKLYQPQSGTIMVNNCNIDSIIRDSLLGHIGCVFQTPILLNRPVGENITLSEDYHEHTDRMDSVMEQVYMQDFIKTLPLGYDTLVGDLGDKLSAGQKQRIVLARSLYKDPELIILDEPTGALDNISEKYIMDTIHRLKGAKTVFIITHKLSILEKVDNILVLESGKICEQGTHKELLAQKEKYFSLYYANQSEHQDARLVT